MLKAGPDAVGSAPPPAGEAGVALPPPVAAAEAAAGDAFSKDTGALPTYHELRKVLRRIDGVY